MSAKKLAKVIILGNAKAGKTCLMNQWVVQKFNPAYRSTIGADFLVKAVDTPTGTINMQLWDTAGDERFGNLGAAFYRGANAVVLVAAASDGESLVALEARAKHFCEIVKAKIPAFIFITKCDEQLRQISTSDVDALVARLAQYVSVTGPVRWVSAKEPTLMDGVAAAFEAVTASCSAALEADVNICATESPASASAAAAKTKGSSGTPKSGLGGWGAFKKEVLSKE